MGQKSQEYPDIRKSLYRSNSNMLAAEQMKEIEEEIKEWVDDGSLPLDKDNNLAFYFLDAHEDIRLPETVYLFGKVPALLSSWNYCTTAH